MVSLQEKVDWVIAEGVVGGVGVVRKVIGLGADGECSKQANRFQILLEEKGSQSGKPTFSPPPT